jgi:hypothetical protein
MNRVSSLGIERITNAVVSEGSELISNTTALATCIEICSHWYCEALVYTSGQSQKLKRTAARRVQATANNLRAQLRGHQLSFYQSIIPNAEVLLKQLADFSDGIETALGLQSDSSPSSGLASDFVDFLGYQDHFKARSPLEWLVGVYLVETYALNFAVKKGTVQKNYSTFAMAVLKEMKVKNGTSYYSAESIRRAARGERDRRKVKKVDDTPFMVERQTLLYAACGRHWKREALSRTLRELESLIPNSSQSAR